MSAEFNEGYWVFILKNFFSNTESIDALATKIMSHQDFNKVISVWFVLLIQESEENYLIKYLLLGGRIAEIARTLYADLHLMVNSLLTWGFFAISRRKLSIPLTVRIKRLLRLWLDNNFYGFKWAQSMLSAFDGIYPKFDGLIDVELQVNGGNIWKECLKDKTTKASKLIEIMNRNETESALEANRSETTQTIPRHSNVLGPKIGNNGLVVTSLEIRTVCLKASQPIFLLPESVNLCGPVYVRYIYGTGNLIPEYNRRENDKDFTTTANNESNNSSENEGKDEKESESDNNVNGESNENNDLAVVPYTENDDNAITNKSQGNDTQMDDTAMTVSDVETQTPDGAFLPLPRPKSRGKNMKTIMAAYADQQEHEDPIEFSDIEDPDENEYENDADKTEAANGKEGSNGEDDCEVPTKKLKKSNSPQLCGKNMELLKKTYVKSDDEI